MKQNPRVSSGLIILIVLVLFLLNLSALAWLGWPALQGRGLMLPSPELPVAQANPVEISTPTPTASLPPTLPPPTAAPILSIGQNSTVSLRDQGVLLISIRDGLYAHLFAYHPGLLPLTRLTNTDWDEVDPAVSPDHKQLVYASRQNGYWDLYLRDLVSGSVERLTDTPEYEGRPSWSPDGQWLVFAAAYDGDLDIYLLSLTDRSTDPILLTDDPSVDSSPSWSPQGRKIAFASTRDGSSQIWVADLDRSDTERFRRISSEPDYNHFYPVWSPDGRYLAWSSERNGEHRLMVWDSQQPDIPPGWSGYGDRPAWSPDGAWLFTLVEEPNQTALEIYERGTARELMPFFSLPGSAYGLSWTGPLEGWLAEAVNRGDTQPAPELVLPVLTLAPNQPSRRIGLVEIADISAPVPMLSDAADEAFQALRLQAALDSGWDILSSLEQAYLPLTTPATPSIQEEWLYTGRAFALNPLILNAGWMVVRREDFYGQTYWRVYLKARFQDGSAGIPLEAPVYDLNARYSGDTTAYEFGGQKAAAPGGYWIDLTELARRYGWERLASKTNWRTFYPAIRFNQFVYRQGLDWNAAMAQMYPAEALATPTSVPTATGTSTPTQGATRFRTTFTPTPTPTSSPTRRPTFTRQP